MKTANIICFAALASQLSVTTVFAGEVVMDGSLGRAGALAGPNYAITSDLGQQLGGNLFHSFSTFNLVKSDTALFSGPATVQNIISRVTGGSASSIDGTLSSSIQGANLYLVNPSGIMFGPNAKLDISGSFSATTADYIRLGTSGRFDATTPAGSLLTVDPPASFGFTGNNPKGISIQGSTLEVSQGKSLSLIGGDVLITSGTSTDGAKVTPLVRAPGGRLDIASVASVGEVVPESTGLAMNSFSHLGSIDVLDGAAVRVSDQGSGIIYIRGDRFLIDNSFISASSTGNVNGGGVDVRLTGDLIATNDGAINSSTFASGEGRKVFIEAENLQLTNGGEIYGITSGKGKGADVSIIVKDTVTISGKGPKYASSIELETVGSGAAGDLSITAPSVSITNDGTINAYTSGSGRAGHVVVNGNNLECSSGGNIDVSSYSSGSGGNLSLNIDDSILISGYGKYFSGLYNSSANGNGGQISIITPSLTVTDNGVITAEIGASATAASQGTDIELNVGRLKVTDAGLINVNNFGAGQAGDMVINASDSVFISGSKEKTLSSLNSQNQGSGSGGNIIISARNISIDQGGQINAVAYAAGAGGDITINTGSLDIHNNAAREASSSYGAGIVSGTTKTGKSGNVKIAASESVTLDGDHGVYFAGITSGSTSTSLGAGDAGDIMINTPVLILKNHGFISTTSYFGKSGNIELDVGELNFSGGEISTSTFGSAQAGELRITASGPITLAGNLNGTSSFDNISQIDSVTMGSGNAGRITITSPEITIGEGGRLATTTEKNLTEQTGAGGDIVIDAGRLTVSGGQVLAYTLTDGNGGNIVVKSAELLVSDKGLISAHSSANGNGGSIFITTPLLTMKDSGYLSVNTLDTGIGGVITLNVDNLLLQNSLISSMSTGSGNAGDITINAKNAVTLDNFSGISSKSSGAGEGGDININAQNALMLQTSSITAATANADGGNIRIDPRLVDLFNSVISATVIGGTGNGGNIDIIGDSVVVDHSKIIANAEGGNGGNINVNSKQFLKSADSIISASSRFGLQGNVEIKAPAIDISASLVNLPSAFLSIDDLAPKQCAFREDEISTFTVIQAGIPPRPDLAYLSK